MAKFFVKTLHCHPIKN